MSIASRARRSAKVKRMGIAGKGPKRRTNAGGQLAIPKIPSLLQRQIDSLIDKKKRGVLTQTEDRELQETLDYLDDLTIWQLTHRPKSRG